MPASLLCCFAGLALTLNTLGLCCGIQKENAAASLKKSNKNSPADTRKAKNRYNFYYFLKIAGNSSNSVKFM
jgi:hypothetical protein